MENAVAMRDDDITIWENAHDAAPLAPDSAPDRATEAGLVARFAAHADEVALGELMRRHGPMVMGVCCRIMASRQDAEDVYQTVWLIFTKKARNLKDKALVANWLYGVAYRVGVKFRRKGILQTLKEQEAAEMNAESRESNEAWKEVREVVDEELQRLPERDRAPLLLCCVEGRTLDEAASCLGWTMGQLRGRLQRARELLRKRLTRRGIAVSSAVFAVVLTPEYTLAAPTLAPTSLLASAASAATGGAAVKTAGLLKEGLQVLFWEKAKLAVAYSVLGATVVGGTVAVSQAPLLQNQSAPVAVSTGVAANVATTNGGFCEIRTVDTNGQPVAGITLSFRQYGTTNRVSVTTDIDGRGRADPTTGRTQSPAGEQAGDLPWAVARASAPSGAWIYASSLAGDVSFHPSAGWVVTRSSNGSSRITVTMRESDLYFAGRVLDPGGKPVPDCAVTATRQGNLNDFGTWSRLSDPDEGGQPLVLKTKTDATGRYRIPAPRGQWVMGIDPPQDTLYNGVPLSRVLNKESVVDDIRLRQGAAVAVRVLDSEGRPVEGLELELQYVPGGYVHGKRTATDKDGYVRWRRLYVHRYEVVPVGDIPTVRSPSGEADRPSPDPKKTLSEPGKPIGALVSAPQPATPRVEVDTKEGEWATVTLKLPPASPPESAAETETVQPPVKADRVLCINLVADEGKPVGGIPVEIRKENTGLPAAYLDPRVKSASQSNATAATNLAKVLSVVAATNGAAVFSNLEPGPYRIKIVPPDSMPYAVVEGRIHVDAVEAETSARILVPKSCRINGVVLDHLGAPVSNIAVSISAWMPDTNSPLVEKTEAASSSRKIEPRPDESDRSPRRMDGLPERTTWRGPSTLSMTYVATNRSDTGGRFVFERVPQGVASITATGDGTNLLSGVVTTNLSGTVSHDIVLVLRHRKPLELSGCVTGDKGEPFPNVTVTFKGRKTLSDTNGCYRFDPTPYPWPRPSVSVPEDTPYGEGHYAAPPASITGHDKSDRTRDYMDSAWCPEEGGAFRFDVKLTPVLLVRLRLEDLKGAPVTNCPLEILDSTGIPRRGLGSRIESPYMRHGTLGRIFWSDHKGIVRYKTTSVGGSGGAFVGEDRDSLPMKGLLRGEPAPQLPPRLMFVPVPLQPRPVNMELAFQGKIGSVVEYVVPMENSHDIAIQVLDQTAGKGTPAEVTLVPLDITEGPDMQKMFGIPLKTDPAGTVRVCGLLSPKYRVEAKSMDTDRFLLAAEQVIEPRAGLNGIEIVMRETGGLVVKVVDPDGAPAPNIAMTVWGKELGMNPHVTNPRYWSGSTDAQGICRIPLCGGTFMVDARVPPLPGATVEPVFVAPPRMEVKSSETSTTKVELRLQRGAVVCVRLCGPDGEPRKRDTLTFRHKTLDYSAWGTVSQQDSNNYWVGPLLPGTYSIAASVNMSGVVWPAPPSAGSFEVTVAAGELKEMDMRLKDLPQVPKSTIQRIDPKTFGKPHRTESETKDPSPPPALQPVGGPTEEQKRFVQDAAAKADANPRDATSQRSAAQALRITGQPLRAAEYYRRALAVEDQTATRWDLAYVLTAARQHRDAIKAYEDLLKRDLSAQESDSAVKAIAESYDALGETDNTLKFLTGRIDDIRTPYIKSWATTRIQVLRGNPR